MITSTVTRVRDEEGRWVCQRRSEAHEDRDESHTICSHCQRVVSCYYRRAGRYQLVMRPHGCVGPAQGKAS